MRRKSVLFTAAVVLLLGGGLTTAALLFWHEPGFYRQKEMTPGELRTKQSRAFEGTFSALLGSIWGEQDRWQAAFTEGQLNSYFAEAFVQSGAATKMLPAGVSDLRLAIDHDVIRLGFRYGRGWWGTVISIDFRVWLVPKESNVVALELLNLRAGAVPISPKTLMRQLAEFTERLNSERTTLDVTWYRHEGHPVALLRFATSSTRPSTQLRQLTVGQGMISVEGRSVPSATQVMLPTPPALPVTETTVVPNAN